MFGMTAAGLTGSIYAAVAVGFLVGTGCAFAEGAIFAQVPAMFPNNSGAVAGVVGGIGSSGGSIYPLLFAAPFLPNLHWGYAVVAVTMLPILALSAWVFQPRVAERATRDGWLVGDEPPTADSPVAADD